MKIRKFAFIFGALLFAFPLAAQAQYYGMFNPPSDVADALNHSLLYPHGSIEVRITQGNRIRVFRGSSTNIFSGPLRPAEICDIEKNIRKDDPLCSGNTREERIGTYPLSVSHLFEFDKKLRGGQGDFKSPAVPLKWSDLVDEDRLRQLMVEKIDPAEGEEETQTGPGAPPVTVTLSVGLYVKNTDPNASREADLQSFSFTVVDYDEVYDLALLRVDHDAQFPYVARVAPKGTELRPWTALVAVGTPVSFGPIPTFGQYFYDTKIGGIEEGYFLSTTPIGPGNSGGGLHSCTNEVPPHCVLVGVTKAVGVSGVGIIPHTAISTPLSQVHTFLERNHLGFLLAK